MMVQVPLKDYVRLHTLVGELYGLLEGGLKTSVGEPHPVASVIDPDTGREIPEDAAEDEDADPPEVQFEEVGLGTPT